MFDIRKLNPIDSRDSDPAILMSASERKRMTKARSLSDDRPDRKESSLTSSTVRTVSLRSNGNQVTYSTIITFLFRV